IVRAEIDDRLAADRRMEAARLELAEVGVDLLFASLADSIELEVGLFVDPERHFVGDLAQIPGESHLLVVRQALRDVAEITRLKKPASRHLPKSLCEVRRAGRERTRCRNSPWSSRRWYAPPAARGRRPSRPESPPQATRARPPYPSRRLRRASR